MVRKFLFGVIVCIMILLTVFSAFSYNDYVMKAGNFTIYASDDDCRASRCVVPFSVSHDNGGVDVFNTSVLSSTLKFDDIKVYDDWKEDVWHDNVTCSWNGEYLENGSKVIECENNKWKEKVNKSGWVSLDNLVVKNSHSPFRAYDDSVVFEPFEEKRFRAYANNRLFRIHKFDINILDPYVFSTPYFANFTLDKESFGGDIINDTILNYTASDLVGSVYYQFSTLEDVWGDTYVAIDNGTTSDLTYPSFNVSGNASPNSSYFNTSQKNYLEIPHNTSLNFSSTNFTANVWLDWNADDLNEDRFHVFQKGDLGCGASNGEYYFRGGESDNGLKEFISFDVSNETGQTISSARWSLGDGNLSVAMDGNWHMWTVKWDGIRARLYKDAELKATGSATTQSMHSTDHNLTIGSRKYTDCSDKKYYEGHMDELSFFKENLTLSRIKELYNKGAVEVSANQSVYTSVDVQSSVNVTKFTPTFETGNGNSTAILNISFNNGTDYISNVSNATTYFWDYSGNDVLKYQITVFNGTNNTFSNLNVTQAEFVADSRLGNTTGYNNYTWDEDIPLWLNCSNDNSTEVNYTVEFYRNGTNVSNLYEESKDNFTGEFVNVANITENETSWWSSRQNWTARTKCSITDNIVSDWVSTNTSEVIEWIYFYNRSTNPLNPEVLKVQVELNITVRSNTSIDQQLVHITDPDGVVHDRTMSLDGGEYTEEYTPQIEGEHTVLYNFSSVATNRSWTRVGKSFDAYSKTGSTTTDTGGGGGGGGGRGTLPECPINVSPMKISMSDDNSIYEINVLNTASSTFDISADVEGDTDSFKIASITPQVLPGEYGEVLLRTTIVKEGSATLTVGSNDCEGVAVDIELSKPFQKPFSATLNLESLTNFLKSTEWFVPNYYWFTLFLIISALVGWNTKGNTWTKTLASTLSFVLLGVSFVGLVMSI